MIIEIVCFTFKQLIQINTLFLTHSSVGGHSGFHLLASVNNAAMSLAMQVSLQDPISVIVDIYPEVRLLGHLAVLFLLNPHSRTCLLIF